MVEEIGTLVIKPSEASSVSPGFAGEVWIPETGQTYDPRTGTYSTSPRGTITSPSLSRAEDPYHGIDRAAAWREGHAARVEAAKIQSARAEQQRQAQLDAQRKQQLLQNLEKARQTVVVREASRQQQGGDTFQTGGTRSTRT